MNESASVAPVDGSTAAVRSALTEHRAPDRLVVARGLFTGPTTRVKDDLYARIVKGRAHRERHVVHLEKGATVDTDTYFGRFAASYYQRWTTVTDVTVGFHHEAGGRAVVALRGSDSGGNSRILATTRDRRLGHGDAVGEAGRLPRRRLPVGGVHRRRRPPRGERTGVDRRRAVGDPARRDRDLHVQPRRRLRRDRRRHRERLDDGVRHRRRVRGRPGQRPRVGPGEVHRGRRDPGRQARLPAAAEPRRGRRIHPRHVRGRRASTSTPT